MKKLIAAILSCAIAQGAFALTTITDERPPITAIWTGAEDGYWTNGNNWVGGIAPGSREYVNEDGETVLNVWKGCTAVFTNGTFTLDGVTYTVQNKKIHYLGMKSICNLVFAGEDIGAYTFIHGLDDYWDTYDFGDPFSVEQGGRVFVAGNVNEPVAFNTLVPGAIDSVDEGGVVFHNDSANEISYYCMGRSVRTDGGYVQSYHIFTGSGPQRFFGWRDLAYAPGFRLMQTGGRVVWDNGESDLLVERFEIPENVGKQTFEIREGSRLGQTGWQSDSYIIAKDDFDLLGPGRLLYGSSYRMGMSIAPGKRIYCTASLQNDGNGIGVYGGGRVILDCTNILAEAVQVWGGTTLDIPRKIGNCGEDSPLSPGNNGVNFIGDGILDYRGPGETTDRPLSINGAVTLKNNGEADLIWAGSIGGDASHTLTFSDSSGDFVLCGSVAAFPVTLANDAKVTFGKAESDESKAYALGALTVAGDSVLSIADGVTVTVASLAHTGGSLNVMTAGTGKLVVTGASEALLPDWIALNGAPARLTASGEVVAVTDPDISIDALGGKIPDAASQVIGIMTAVGEGESVTLAQPEVAVLALVQGQAVADAVVALGSGEKLTAGMVVSAEGAKPLSVAGTGTIEMDDLRGTLTVADAATVRIRKQQSAGEVKIASDTKPVLDFKVKGGSLALTGGEDGNEAVLRNGEVDASSELVIDGAEISQEGFDYATWTASDVDRSQEKPGLVVGSTNGVGVLKMKSGSYTGVFFAGRGESNSELNKSAVYQSGGRFSFAGSPDGESSVLGATGYNYFELKGGVLNPVGDYYIGPDMGVGIMAILGGEYHQGGAGMTGDRSGRIRLGAYNSCAHLLVRNGKLDYSEAGGEVLMPSYGRVDTDAVFTLEDGADVDFGYNVLTFGLGSASDNPCCYSIVNLNGGVFKGTLVRRLHSYVAVSQGGSGGEQYANTYCYVNFNGGAFQVKNNCEIFGAEGEWSFTPSRITVYGNGGTIDSGNFWVTVNNSFASQNGMGLVSVPLPEAVSGTKMIGAPYVLISGDGHGATAYADFDSETGHVTGIHVTSPGNDYTWAKAKFYYGNDRSGKHLLAEADCEVGADAAGCLSLAGGGHFMINRSSPDFRGDLVVKQGTYVHFDNYVSYPAATILMDGGYFGVVSNLTVKSIRATANGGTVEPALSPDDGCILTLAGYTADLEDALAGNVVEVASKVAFSAPIRLDNLQMISENPELRRTVLAKFSGGIVGELPEVSAETPVPDGWKLNLSTNGALRLSKISGMVITIR